MYYNSDLYKVTMEAAKGSKTNKSRRNTCMSRTDVKNYTIMRHIFERLREQFGPYDHFRGGLNYKKVGVPYQLPAAGPKSPYDIHVVKWQLELIDAELITFAEIIAPASVYMHTQWALTHAPINELWKVQRIANSRRPAQMSGWLLTSDLIALEALNYSVPINYATTISKPPKDEKTDEFEEITEVDFEKLTIELQPVI